MHHVVHVFDLRSSVPLVVFDAIILDTKAS